MTKSEKLKLYEDDIDNAIVTTSVEDGWKRFYKLYADHCNPTQTQNLSVAASIVTLSVKYMKAHALSEKKHLFFEILAQKIELAQLEYLPYNHRRLREKIVEHLNGSPVEMVIKLPRAGNKYRVIKEDDLVSAWLIYMRNLPQNYTNEYIIRKIRHTCDLTGRQRPSDGWFERRFASKQIQYLTANGRYGAKGKYGSKYRGYNLIAAPLFAGDCWQIDGTRDNKIPITIEGKKVYPYMIVVRDVYSGCVLGVTMSLSESGLNVKEALWMAANNAGYLPYELVHDKYPGYNTKDSINLRERLEKAGVKVTITANATGKAQVERWFGTLQTVFSQESDYYYGEGIMSRRLFAHRSGEHLKKMQTVAKNDGWDWDKAVNLALRTIDAYNTTPLSMYSRKHKVVTESPRQLHDSSEKPNTIGGTKHTIQSLLILGYTKELIVRNQGMIETEIMGIKHHFQIEEFDIWCKYKAVRVAYDIDNLNKVEVFDIDTDRHLCTAQAQKRIQVFGPDANYGALQKSKTRIKENNERLKAELEARIAPAVGTFDLLQGGVFIQKDALNAAEDSYLAEYLGIENDAETPIKVLGAVPEEKEGIEETEKVHFDPRKYARGQY